jgi:ATP-dependent RNA helicase SUPV3L1/SUV3
LEVAHALETGELQTKLELKLRALVKAIASSKTYRFQLSSEMNLSEERLDLALQEFVDMTLENVSNTYRGPAGRLEFLSTLLLPDTDAAVEVDDAFLAPQVQRLHDAVAMHLIDGVAVNKCIDIIGGGISGLDVTKIATEVNNVLTLATGKSEVLDLIARALDARLPKYRTRELKKMQKRRLLPHISLFLDRTITSDQKAGAEARYFDLSRPEFDFPAAMMMKRRIIYHAGPTNSGKTYYALQRLQQARTKEGGGIFLAPLRLLALEVYERLNAEGPLCSLSTGQELRDVPMATHLACTIEMFDERNAWDVAVVDEVQLIGDEHRGHSWTKAIMGLQAHEIHVCGSPAAIDTVKAIAKKMGDSFEVKRYERRTTLSIADTSLESDYSKIQPGDCVVAFSRRDIYAIKHKIEELTSLKCCVVYGHLPPMARSNQARRFNEAGTGYDVLVATDAIGLGLNLNIRRIVFHVVAKFNGKKTTALDFPLVKQIAGRAGRSGTQYENGLVTTLHGKDMEYLRRALETVDTPVEKAYVGPSLAQIERYAHSAAIEATTDGNIPSSDDPAATGDVFLKSEAVTSTVDDNHGGLGSIVGSDEGGEKVWNVDEMAILEKTASGETKVLQNLETLCNTGEEYTINSMDDFKLKAQTLSAIPQIAMADLHTLCVAPVNSRNKGELNKFFRMSQQVCVAHSPDRHRAPNLAAISKMNFTRCF